jgi:hypothetical protein
MQMLKVVRWAMLSGASLAAFGQASAKRPPNHRDCDGWNAIQSQARSRNAKLLAYSQVPEGRDDQQEHEKFNSLYDDEIK